jgi:hypothetical protein
VLHVAGEEVLVQKCAEQQVDFENRLKGRDANCANFMATFGVGREEGEKTLSWNSLLLDRRRRSANKRRGTTSLKKLPRPSKRSALERMIARRGRGDDWNPEGVLHNGSVLFASSDQEWPSLRVVEPEVG